MFFDAFESLSHSVKLCLWLPQGKVKRFHARDRNMQRGQDFPRCERRMACFNGEHLAAAKGAQKMGYEA